jgi:hypothetical protein
MKELTKEQRSKLAAVATDLMAIWNELPIADDEEGMDWCYRGGLVQLTCKGGYTQGWADLSWNDVITDIYAGEKLACSYTDKRFTYEKLVEEANKEAEERDEKRKAANAARQRRQDIEDL